jgi:uncharacterized protein YhaN
MIFRRIHVDGFGIWKDLDLDRLSAGLNVFLAPNEGGKSTLMAFIRAVLFGFKRRGDARRYDPLRGGRHGGFLDVQTEGRPYRIRRNEGSSSRGELKVSAADGSRFGDAKLESLLRHTTETLYENVFAFGLEELQRLDSLHSDDVAGHIYSAGMGSGALSPVAFRTEMRSSMSELYKARGKKQPIARLLQDVEAQQERIEQLRQRPEEHAELLRQYRRLRQRLADFDEHYESCQQELDFIQRAQRAWPEYERLLEAEATFEGIGVSAERLAQASAGSRGLRAEARATVDAQTTENSVPLHQVALGQSTVSVDETLDAVSLMSTTQRELLQQASKIRGLLASSDRLRELHATVLDRQRTARELRHDLFGDLEDFGDGWSLERIRAARTDVSARDEVRRWQERLQKTESDISATETRADDANLVYEAMREGREQIGRGTLLVSWGLILLAVAATAILVPAPARLVSTASIVSVGGLLGMLVSWLHFRGLRQRRAEQSLAAAREADLWHEHDQAKEAYSAAVQEWKSWLRQERMPADLSTQGSLDLIDRIRQTQQKDQAASNAEAAVTAATAELQGACMNVLTVIEELDRQTLDLRYDALKMVDPLLATIEGLQSELEDVEEHRERVRRVVDDHARSRAALRALAGEEGTLAFRRRLESTDPETVARKVGEAQAEVASARADRDALAENLGALREQIRTLETDEELAEQLQERESKRALLATAVEDWAAYSLTAALYDEAKSKYEAERQPEVLRLGSRYFSMMTDNRYSRVIAPLGENRLEVERSDNGERLEPQALSRGTGEQLYLAMRLALAKVYGSQAVPLPLVADDILVNFDDDRARATARLLDTFAAEGHQILAFTCHRHLVTTFERNAPHAEIRELPAHA